MRATIDSINTAISTITTATEDPMTATNTNTSAAAADTEVTIRITPDVRKAGVLQDAIDALENAASVCEAALLAAADPHTHHVLSVGVWVCEHAALDLKGHDPEGDD